MPSIRPTSLLVLAKSRGFTLVEIALAIGIFAFAIVAIMALFPIGLRSASESRIESIVTQIARTVLSDLRTGDFDKARVITAPLPTTPNTAPAAGVIREFDLSNAAPVPEFVLYSQTGAIVQKITTQALFNAPLSGGDFAVKVESRLIQTTNPKLAQITVTVESPAAAPTANRSKYSITTLMGDTR